MVREKDSLGAGTVAWMCRSHTFARRDVSRMKVVLGLLLVGCSLPTAPKGRQSDIHQGTENYGSQAGTLGGEDYPPLELPTYFPPTNIPDPLDTLDEDPTKVPDATHKPLRRRCEWHKEQCIETSRTDDDVCRRCYAMCISPSNNGRQWPPGDGCRYRQHWR